MDWEKSREPRDQLVPFPSRPDEAIGQDHQVRRSPSALAANGGTEGNQTLGRHMQ